MLFLFENPIVFKIMSDIFVVFGATNAPPLSISVRHIINAFAGQSVSTPIASEAV
jgi:hypothetical protein